MNIHPAVSAVINNFQAKELHAARSGRDVMSALSKMIVESSTGSVPDLFDEIDVHVDALLAVMPAYAPPINVLHKILSRVEEAQAEHTALEKFKAWITNDAQDFQAWSNEARTNVTRYGFEVIPDGATVFTFTLSETVLRTLRAAWAQGKRFRVRVTESRPNNDGLATAALLNEEGIPVELSIDACLGELVSSADLMISGAEAVLFDGSIVCKVGTYPAALVAKAFGIPFYTLVDTMKFDLSSRLGLPLWMDPIEHKDIPLKTGFSRTRVAGYLFDRTPASLIKGIVTEKGILSPRDCAALMSSMTVSEKFYEKLRVWACREH